MLTEHSSLYIPENEKPLQEKCGIVALYNPTDNIPQQLAIALSAAGGVQHRGQQGAGIAMNTENGLRSYIGKGLLKQVFTPDVMSDLQSPAHNKWTMVHCRYGTNGGYDDRNLQPTITRSDSGSTISVIHNGEFVATERMRRQLNESFPEDISDTYLFSQMLTHAEGRDWDEKVVNTLSNVNGAYSLAIGIDDSLYVARDQFGLRPLVLGKLINGWIAASETHALDKIGIPTEREVKRGEILRIDDRGLTILQEGLDGGGNYCDFEWDYFSRPNSLSPTHEKPDDATHPERWLSNLVARERVGKFLAQERPIPNATFVVGVPDSGVAVATGYAMEARLPYRQVILRDHFDENGNMRLFQGDNDKEDIGRKVLGKLSLVPGQQTWEDAIVVVGDDSVVRGNVTTEITRAIFDAGAKEVHWVSGYPAVQYPCHLGVSTRSRDELIAARHNGNEVAIAEEIGASSVNYVSFEGFIRARKLSGQIKIPANRQEIFLANDGCGGCVTGLYPISKEGVIYESDSLQK